MNSLAICLQYFFFNLFSFKRAYVLMKEAHELEATLKLDLTLIFNVPTAQPLHLTRKSVNFITPAITDLP